MDKLISQKEVIRLQVLDLMNEGNITQREASGRLGITPRQVRRLVKRFEEEGLSGLVSKKRGKPSNRKLSEVTRNQIIELMVPLP